jgi:TPP-dependent pyruvate/acetoin dehydrogenase alpha subunit
MNPNLKTQTDLFYKMLRIRRIEEAIAERYSEQKMRTPVHLSIGQEAVAAVVGAQLNKDDYAVSTHRAHAHYLAKGGSLRAMLAEIYGKVTGCCRGRGGSMHLIDQSVGFMGSTAIVGNTIPIGVGLGLAISLAKTKQISCVFVGDGAIEEGVFFEALNFSVLKKLPLLFICENNRYSVYTPFAKRQPAQRNIYEVMAAMGAKVNHADGYDVLASYAIVEQAVAGLRQGEGPHFLEFETYRWREHCGPNYDNDIGYRSEAEFLAWQQRDAIVNFKKYLSHEHHVSELQWQEMAEKISEEIAEAFKFAESSPFPDAIEAVTGQYKMQVKESHQLAEPFCSEEVL